ncbi:MAG: threonine synthase [Nitrososphaerales archaeon]
MRETSLQISLIETLECSRCKKKFDHHLLNTVCDVCSGALFARYDLSRNKLTKRDLLEREKTIWRYFELLPLNSETNIVSLGEGCTPLLNTSKLGKELNFPNLLIKDDGLIPTGTFKARGQSVAISKARELGIRNVALASAGNAGSAAATYSSRAGIKCDVFMPEDSPEATKKECLQMGASLHLVQGLINDAAKLVSEGKNKFGWLDLSTLKEPYRVEGKKTMGFELAEQLGWKLPDVIIYPTGGGTGLVGMWKAFEELEEMGWINSERPRMVSVQAEGCKPVVDTFQRKKDHVETPYPNAKTIASGLRVPFPFGSEQILKVINESKGTALAVSDQAILDSMKKFATNEGVFVCPEGAATLAALETLEQDRFVDHGETIVLYNTGSGLKYLELLGI